MHYVSGVSRRAGASAARANAKFMISSTFWYSGIFAAAATWDAGRKQKRRDQWDRAIADLRQDVGREVKTEDKLEVVEEQRLEMEEDEAYQPFGGSMGEVDSETVGVNLLDKDVTRIEDECVANQLSGQRVKQNADTDGQGTAYRTFESLEFDGENPLCDPAYVGRKVEWTANTGRPLNKFNLAPQSIYATDERRSQSEQRPWSAKKLATVQASIEVLLVRIFYNLQQRGSLDEALQDLPENFKAGIPRDADILNRQRVARSNHLRNIKMSLDGNKHELEALLEQSILHPDLRNGFCSYGQDASGAHRTTLEDLNRSLQRLFDEHKRTRHISTTSSLGRICYNLSLSSAPPDVNTYNILLLGLSALKERKIVDYVIQSAFESHIRINEITNNAILRHNIAIDRADHFVRHLGRIRGEHGGVMLARSNLTIDDTNGSRLRRIGENMEKMVQLPHPCPHIMHAIIAGVVKFFGFDSSLAMIEQMQHDGWGLNMAGLGPLLEDCAERGDWDSGSHIWMHILSLKSLSRRSHKGLTTYDKISRQAFRAMLKLCLKCEQSERYEHTWNMLRSQHGGKVTERVTRDARGLEFAISPKQEDSPSGVGQIDTTKINDGTESTDKGDVPAAPSIPQEIAPPVPLRHDLARSESGLIERTKARTIATPESLREEQLMGSVQFGDELDAYEIGERPMALRS